MFTKLPEIMMPIRIYRSKSLMKFREWTSMNSTENIREGPCVIDPFKVRLNQKLKIDVNFLFFLIFYQKKYERARNLHFLRRLQAGHWRGWYQKFTPSLSFTFIPTMFYSMASEMSIWLHHPLQYAPIRSLRYF